MNNTNNKIQPQKVNTVLLIYAILTLYYFGSIIFSYFIDYTTYQNVHEHFNDFMTLTIRIKQIGFILPAVLMLVSALALWWFCLPTFPKWAIGVSIGMAVISVVTSIFIILPIYYKMLSAGFNSEIYQKLVLVSLYFQIIPASIQCIILVGLLNINLRNTRFVSRWLFIIVFTLTFYAFGHTIFNTTEAAIWLSVGEKDWMAFRNSGSGFGTLIAVYFLPDALPMFLMILLFWLHPKGIPLIFPLIIFGINLIVLYVSATYFAPKIQFELDKGYSRQLIDDYWLRNFGRYSLGLLTYILTAWMFLKIDRSKKVEPN